MGNFDENLNLGNRFRPPPWLLSIKVIARSILPILKALKDA